MFSIAKLFGKSPFAPLQTHMKKVTACIEKLSPLFEAAIKGDSKKIKELSKEISTLEHKADLTKNDIRNHLPNSLFLPIDRGSLLEILSLQDSLADKSEDIGIILTLGTLHFFDEIQPLFISFSEMNIEAFFQVKQIMEELDALIESTFGGIEAEKVKIMVEKIAFKEHEIDKIQYKLLQQLYQAEEKLTYSQFHIWVTLLKEISGLSNLSEKLANRVRMILELK